MQLHHLIQNLVDYHAFPEKEIIGLTLNSKEVCEGDAFIAIKGQSHDGRRYINDAIARGARAVLCEASGLSGFSYLSSPNIPVIPIKNLENQLIYLAKRFYGEPALELIGVTGTNGKTTSCYLLAQALSRLSLPSAVIGSLGYGFVNQLTTSALNTPDPISLQKYLNVLSEKGAKVVAMEVSSHGLAQNRVKNMRYHSAIFTNLTQDHLDYHGTMDAYGKAKQKLFQMPGLKQAIINADSPYAQKILSVISPDVKVIMVSVRAEKDFSFYHHPSLSFITTKTFTLDHGGIKAEIQTPWGEGVLRSSLLGEFNLSNLLGVLAELLLRQIPLKDALHALSFAGAAPGRMQRLGGVREPQIIIDYAHTPDALEKALQAARLHCQRRLWCVFGCGGDRDKDKRAKMGEIVSRLADKVVLTNDNPRTENPERIINDILKGISVEFNQNVFIREDRGSAIEYAFSHTLPLDTILIAGKGHEDYQIIADKKLPFNDAEYVKKLLTKDDIA